MIKDALKQVNAQIDAAAKDIGLEGEQLKTAIKYRESVVADILRCSGYDQKGGGFLVVVPKTGELLRFQKDDFQRGVSDRVGEFYDQRKLGTILKAFAESADDSGLAKAVGEAIKIAVQRAVLSHRQFASITMEVDLFADYSHMEIDDGVMRVTLHHTKIKPRIKAVMDDARIALANEHADAYREFWPMFDEFVELVAASRVASTRKKAYVWMHAPSDWGKGVLEEVFDILGLVTGVSVKEVEAMFEGKPVGKTLDQFKRSMILWVNEFKAVKSELKQVENHAYFSPKHLATVKVSLYLKMFTSAEQVQSLASKDSGVEAQFANRFSYLTPTGGIEGVPEFMLNKGAFIESIAWVVSEKLNELFDDYKAMGRDNAAVVGGGIVEAFHKAHGISNRFRVLGAEMFEDLVLRFYEWVAELYSDGIAREDGGARASGNVRKVLDNAIEYDDGTGKALFVKRAKSLVQDFLDDIYPTASERGKLNWKVGDIKAEIPEPENTRYGRNKGRYTRICSIGFDGMPLDDYPTPEAKQNPF